MKTLFSSTHGIIISSVFVCPALGLASRVCSLSKQCNEFITRQKQGLILYTERLAKELYKKPWIVYTESLSRRTRRFKANSDKTIPIS